MSTMNSRVLFAVGLVVALAAINDFILVPLVSASQTEGQDFTGGGANNTTGNQTITSTGSSRLFTDPVGFIFDFFNPLNFDSLKTGTSGGNFLVELGAKAAALGGLIVGFISGVVNGNSGQSGAALVVTLQAIIFKLLFTMSATFNVIPVVGVIILAAVALYVLVVTIYAQATLLAGSGG